MAAEGNITVIFTDSKGNYIPGAEVYYYDSGWKLLGITGDGPTTMYLPKKTDVEIRPASGGKYKWVGVDPTTNPTLSISTIPVTVKLETCRGTPLVGEVFYYKDGWRSIGNTPVTIELLPYTGLGPGQGNYDFRVKYGGRTSPIHTQDIAVNPVVVFKTTKVTLYGPNVLYYNDGWKPFTSPMEMIGGVSNRYGTVSTCDFKFDGPRSPTVTLNIVGCELTKCYRIVELRDSKGNLITNSGATIVYQPDSAGSYIPFGDGVLDASGREAAVVDCGKHRYRLTYLGCTQEMQTSADIVTYQTHLVTVELRDSSGALIQNTGATIVWQPGSAGDYVPFGDGVLNADGTESMEVLPLRHRFRLTYLGATQEKQSSAAIVTYQTQRVTVELRDSSGNLVTGTDATIVWQPGSAGSYVLFGSNAELQTYGYTSMEVLPLKYRFRMTYRGKTVEKQTAAATVTYYVSEF
jgi:hypothetical protein